MLAPLVGLIISNQARSDIKSIRHVCLAPSRRLRPCLAYCQAFPTPNSTMKFVGLCYSRDEWWRIVFYGSISTTITFVSPSQSRRLDHLFRSVSTTIMFCLAQPRQKWRFPWFCVTATMTFIWLGVASTVSVFVFCVGLAIYKKWVQKHVYTSACVRSHLRPSIILKTMRVKLTLQYWRSVEYLMLLKSVWSACLIE